MPWISDTEYVYTPSVLERMALSYKQFYTDLSVWGNDLESLHSRLEYKADFDIALDSIGEGHWCGMTDTDFRAYYGFGRRQRVIIAQILGISDFELQPYGFSYVSQVRGRAYYEMCAFLNGNATAIMKAREERWGYSNLT